MVCCNSDMTTASDVVSLIKDAQDINLIIWNAPIFGASATIHSILACIWNMYIIIAADADFQMYMQSTAKGSNLWEQAIQNLRITSYDVQLHYQNQQKLLELKKLHVEKN